MRARVVTVLAVAAMAAAGCSAGASSSTGAAGASGATGAARTSVTLGFGAAPENLDFTTTDGSAIPQVLLDNVYQGLVRLDDSGAIVPSLASKWTESADHTTYDFTLVSGATFSNGDPFTADDVKFSIERVLSPAWTVATYKTYMSVVAGVDVLSPTRVRVRLSRPSNNWLFDMTTRMGAMFDPRAVTDLAEHAVGTGPYTVSDFTRDTRVVLTRRDDYRGSRPAVKTVTFQYYNDVNAENSALASGGLDGIVGFSSPDSLAQFRGRTGYRTVQGTTNGEVVLSLNNARGVFTDKRIRQAVNYAIDRTALIKAANGGYGTLIGSMVPPTDAWYDPGLAAAYPYDPGRARQLLAAAGGKNLTVDFEVPTNLAYADQAAQVVAADLKKVGITARIIPTTFPSVWLNKVFNGHDYDMSIIDHTEARDIATFGQPGYYWGYDNPRVRQLLASADAGTVAEQTADLKQVARILSDDAVADWLYLAPSLDVLAAGLSGLPRNALGEGFDVTGVSWS